MYNTNMKWNSHKDASSSLGILKCNVKARFALTVIKSRFCYLSTKKNKHPTDPVLLLSDFV